MKNPVSVKSQKERRESSRRFVTSWRDFLCFLVGCVVAVSPAWTGVIGAPALWVIAIGIVVAALGLWAFATYSAPGIEWLQLIAASLLLVLPWISAPAEGAWAWASALIVLVLTVWSIVWDIATRR